VNHITISVPEIHYSTYVIRNVNSEQEAVEALSNDLGSIRGNIKPNVEIEHIMTELSHMNLEPEYWKIEK
jgi:hypothetical protein